MMTFLFPAYMRIRFNYLCGYYIRSGTNAAASDRLYDQLWGAVRDVSSNPATEAVPLRRIQN